VEVSKGNSVKEVIDMARVEHSSPGFERHRDDKHDRYPDKTKWDDRGDGGEDNGGDA